MKKLGVNSLSELIKYAVKFNQMDKLDWFLPPVKL
jgi:hypothetical protein